MKVSLLISSSLYALKTARHQVASFYDIEKYLKMDHPGMFEKKILQSKENLEIVS